MVRMNIESGIPPGSHITDPTMKHTLLILSLGVCAMPAFAGTYTVNVLSDLPDANPGDGKCSAMLIPLPNTATCTLRAAIQEANRDPASELSKVVVERGKTYSLTIAGATEQLAARGDLDILKRIDLRAVGGIEKPRAVIHANGLDRVLHFGPKAAGSRVKGVELRGGWASNGRGVGAFIDGQNGSQYDIVFEDVLVRGNKPLAGNGSTAACAIEAVENADIQLIRSEIRDNSSAGLCIGVGGMLVTRQLSIHHNKGGGVVSNSGKPLLDIEETAIFRNLFGMRFGSEATNVFIVNSTLAMNTGPQLQLFAGNDHSNDPPAIAGSIIGTGTDTACDVPEDLVIHPGYTIASMPCGALDVADAALVEFSPMDGRPWALVPSEGSVAIDSVPAHIFSCTGSAQDLLGAARPFGEGCDAGAIEVH